MHDEGVGYVREQRRNAYDGGGRLYSARVLNMTDSGLSGGYITTYSDYGHAGNVMSGVMVRCIQRTSRWVLR